MRLDDEQDITLDEMLADAQRFPLQAMYDRSGGAAAVPRPREVRMPDTPINLDSSAVVVPDSCVRLVDGPLVGL